MNSLKRISKVWMSVKGLSERSSSNLKIPFSNPKPKISLAIPKSEGPWFKRLKMPSLTCSYKIQASANGIIERIVFNEKLRKELANVKKEAKEKQKKISFKIPKLRDCKYHFQDDPKIGNKTMIFLTEGDSASASIVASRDPYDPGCFFFAWKAFKRLRHEYGPAL